MVLNENEQFRIDYLVFVVLAPSVKNDQDDDRDYDHNDHNRRCKAND